MNWAKHAAVCVTLAAAAMACLPPYCIDRSTGIWKQVDPGTGRASFMTPVPVPTGPPLSFTGFSMTPAPTLQPLPSVDPRPVIGRWTDHVVNGKGWNGEEEQYRGKVPGNQQGH